MVEAGYGNTSNKDSFVEGIEEKIEFVGKPIKLGNSTNLNESSKDTIKQDVENSQRVL